jgi:hypothetical protein
MEFEREPGDPMPSVSRAALRRRRIVSSVCVLGMLVQMGCYASVPIQPTGGPYKGPITVNVNDRGRLLVGAKLGSLLDRVDGFITNSTDSTVLVTVKIAYDVRGAQVNWGGEPVVFPRDGIANIEQRRVEPGSTLLVVGGIVAAIVSLFIGLHHQSSGNGGTPPDGGTTINRIPR